MATVVGAAGFGMPGRAFGATGRKKIAIGILGQSNEQNRVHPHERATFPQAFQSLRQPEVQAPQPGNLVQWQDAEDGSSKPFGGMWFSLYDALWDQGYDCAFVNGAIGNASLVFDIAGASEFWRPNDDQYFEQRLPQGPGDNGHAGSLVLKGRVPRSFRCVRGRQRFAILTDGSKVAGIQDEKIDFIKTIGHNRSGEQEPAWDNLTAPGQTIADGDLIWRLEGNHLPTAEAQSNQRFVFDFDAYLPGWDPNGIIDRLLTLFDSVGPVEHRFVIIQNGQSDYGGTDERRHLYQAALENISARFQEAGIYPVIGLSCYTPLQPRDSWEGLSRARARVLNNNRFVRAKTHPILAGANLFEHLGTNIDDLLQEDRVHLNAKGAIAAGSHWGHVFSKILAQVGS